MRGIGTKLFTLISIIILTFSSFFLYRTYTISKRHVNSVVETQAEIALQFDLSIRKYVADKIRPIMYDLVGEKNFIPEAMSTSFVARSIFEDVKARFPDYVLKFSSDDPRNPANLAGPEELKVIRYFNTHPEVKTWSGNIIIDDKEYFAKFNARRMKKSCLHCHGKPEDAPQSLIDRYGAEAGFHRPVGEVIALDTVGIPIQSVQEKLWEEITDNFIFIALAFILLYLTLFVSVKFLVTNRLSRITKHFTNASVQEDDVQIEPIAETGHRDEISTLAVSFNTLAWKLKKYHNSLEGEIQEREKTEERLRQSNTTLENVLESSSPICITGTDFEIILANRAYYDIWPGPEKDEGPVKCYQSRHGSLCKTDACPLTQIIQGKEEVIVDATKYGNSGEEMVFIVTARPYRDDDGKLIGIVENFQDITRRKKLEDEKADLIQELQASLEKVKLLSGFIPICASCKKIRDDKGYWNQVESYIREHSDAEFSHSICPECAKEYYDELNTMLDKK